MVVAPPPDFSRYTREQLLAMLFAGDPAAVRAAAAQWSDIATAFYSRVADLERQLRDFERFWSGGAADRYQLMIKSLIDGLKSTADVARLTADRIYSAAEALESLQAWVIQNMKSSPALALVLTRLARRYQDLAVAVPQPPQTAMPPTATEVLSRTYLAQAVPQSQTPPLFAGLYSNGIESARAALGGRFEQSVPALAAPSPQPVLAAANGTPVTGTPVGEKPAVEQPVLETPAVTPAPALGRASVDIPSFGPVGAGPISAGPISAGPTGGAPMTNVAAVSPMIPPMMPPMIPPMMPPMMGGMNGGELGGGGQDSKWLREPKPERVFGVPLQYMPQGVIGEPSPQEEPAPGGDSWGFE